RGGKWGEVNRDEYVDRLSQEHGVVKATAERISLTKEGDIVYVLPVHSCMTADLMRSYSDLTGHVIPAGTY
ncbi:MAG: hypothetical protein KDD36_15110, partial [Flavobacteriales bacterium]|nr:hypothetical protein [Flavobacteriales bacterium]